MAITTTDRRVLYTGNGVAATFAFTFKVFKPEDLLVLMEDISGIQSTLVYGTDFSVVLNADQDVSPGGSITLTAGPLTSGYTLLVTSDIAELQQVILTNLGGFYPDVINDALDRLTILVQQLQNLADQSIRMNIMDDISSAQLPPASSRAGKFLYFDTAGNVSLVSASPSGAAVFAGAPSGTINGTNRTFALPTTGSLVQFFYNGVLQTPPGDYVISGSNIIMANAPVSGDSLYALIFG